MKRAKIVACLAALMLILNFTAAGQVRLGVKAGLNLANIDYKVPVDYNPDILPTFHAGGIIEFGIGDVVAISTGMLLQGKGYKYTESNNDYTFKYRTNTVYLQVPVQVVLHGKGIYVAIGPYAAVGVMGKEKIETTPVNREVSPTKEERDLNFGNNQTDDYSALDAGACVELGYESKMGLRFTFNYQIGFADLRPSYHQDANLGDRSVFWAAGFSVTHMIDLNRKAK